jgi:hypothetical protein
MMPRSAIMRGRRRVAIGAAAVALVVSACSGVPSSSSPEVIHPAEGDPSAAGQPLITPQPGAEAREIVKEFLNANVGEPDDPRSAHLFLTAGEQSKWSDNTVAILQQDPRIDFAVPDGDNKTRVTVSGIQIGRLLADGTYTPEPAATGGGGQQWQNTFTLVLVDGQWRISDLPDGLIVTEADFAAAYLPARKLYFFDTQEEHLVPDLRYSALTSEQAIASWQLTQLLGGPRAQLDFAVRSEVPPSQGALSARPSIKVTGQFDSVELPGSSQLDAVTKRKLAAQLMATFGQLEAQAVMTITDGGRPIDIPSIPQRFTKSDISAATGLFGSIQPPVFYIDRPGRLVDAKGALVEANGKPFKGPLGPRPHILRSVAVAARNSDNYEVAVTTGSGASEALWIGKLVSSLHKAEVGIGPLTRPSWAPGLTEAWVASGAHLFRVSDRAKAIEVETDLPEGGAITALRFSADGTRLALIVQGKTGGAQLWIAAVVRAGGPVRLDNAQQITTPAYALTDVAWNDDTTLYVIGKDSSQNPGIWSIQADGSNLQPRPSGGLPSAPNSITAAPGGGMPAWVSAGPGVFQETSDWEGPNNQTTYGSNPVYLE